MAYEYKRSLGCIFSVTEQFDTQVIRLVVHTLVAHRERHIRIVTE